MAQATVSPARFVRTSAQAPSVPSRPPFGRLHGHSSACPVGSELALPTAALCGEHRWFAGQQKENKHRVSQVVLIALRITASARTLSIAFAICGYKSTEFTNELKPVDRDYQAHGGKSKRPTPTGTTNPSRNPRALNLACPHFAHVARPPTTPW